MRAYASVGTSIWDDPDFCARSAGAQRTYFMLFSQKDISACGILPLTVRRWGNTVQKSEQQETPNWLTELVANHYICIDDSTEELLVRTFIRHDRGWSNRNRRPVVLAALAVVRSPDLRLVLAGEARKLDFDIGAVFSQVNAPSDAPVDGAPEAPADGPPDAPSRGLKPLTLNLKPSTSHSPSVSVTARSARDAHTRGVPIPADFAITAAMRKWADTTVPGMDLLLPTQKFVNHFLSMAGAKSMSKDWIAAWRNWMLGDYERAAAPNANGHGNGVAVRNGVRPSTTDRAYNDALNLGRAMQADENRRNGAR